MHRPLVWFLLLLAACSDHPASGNSQSARSRPDQNAADRIDSTSLANLVDSAMAQGMAQESIPGAAFILVDHGRVVLAKGYGQADVESGAAWSPDSTVFPIASISKVFTATAAMQLVDRGQIALDADVNRYLKSARVPATYPQPITTAHLLSHTAGLDELPGRRVRSERELVPLGKFLGTRLVRVHPPGEITSYSTYGIALAGLMVQDVAGLPFEDYLRLNIWQPLGMTQTSVTPPKGRNVRLATAYERDEGKLLPVPYEIYQTPPTSSILSTAEDMGRFIVTLLQHGRSADDNRILSDSATSLMLRQYATLHPKLPGWSLGWQLNDLNGRRLAEHGGDIGGFSSNLTLMPDEGVGFFVVHHLEGRNLRFDLRQLILDRFFPDSRAPQVPVAKPDTAGRLRRFAGTYRASIYCHSCRDGAPNVPEFEVKANPDGTIGVWDDRWTEVSPLYFVNAAGRKRIGFAEDKKGRVFALTAGSWKVLERVDGRTD